MKKKKIKVKWKSVIIIIMIIFSITCILISLTQIIKWNSDNKNIEKQINDIDKIVEINEITNEETVIENTPQKEEISKENPYWDYIKMNLIDVDLSKLKQKNNDTVGWIQVNGTNINYPFVQTTDNKFYLKHSFDKKYNAAGWVFLDYRNQITSLDKNTIIYAHGRIDNTMFGSLKNILTSGWLNNTDNYVVKMSTEYGNTLWQVFSVYHIPTTNDYIRTNFKSNKNFLTFANTLIERSQHDFNTTINEDDHILTLSTCYNDKEKVVLHAKLIKQSINKNNNSLENKTEIKPETNEILDSEIEMPNELVDN